MNLTDTEAAYLAGLIDGEGCLSVSFRKPNKALREVNEQLCIQFSLSMCHEETIRYIAEITDTKNKIFYVKPRNDRNRPQWCWRPSIAKGEEIIRRCEPFMVTKKRNAQIYLELISIRRQSTRSERQWPRQKALAEENIILNKRGTQNS